MWFFVFLAVGLPVVAVVLLLVALHPGARPTALPLAGVALGVGVLYWVVVGYSGGFD